jgi:uncharacterized delta-60 repeat protein
MKPINCWVTVLVVVALCPLSAFAEPISRTPRSAADPGLAGNSGKARSGSLDPAFGAGGTVVTDTIGTRRSQASAAVQQPDHKILALGWADRFATSFDERDFALARYNADGTLDPTFGRGGKTTTDFVDLIQFNQGGASDVGSALAVQPDGRILAVGTAYGCSPADTCNSGIAAARYLEDGSPDPSFGQAGRALSFDTFTDFETATSGMTEGNAIAIQSDGRIVVAGRARNILGEGDFVLARYNTDGGPDPSFGQGGLVTTDFKPGVLDVEGATAVFVQSDGKILAAGAGSGFEMARYNSDGSLDPDFGVAGLVTATIGSRAVLLGNGKILATGVQIGSTSTIVLTRYNADGSLDPTFNGSGSRGVPVALFFDLSGLRVRPDGKIILSGTSHANSADLAVVRLNEDGTLDGSFGNGGVVQTDFASNSSDDRAEGLALQSDGAVIVVGSTSGSGGFPCYSGLRNNFDFVVARYNGSDGSLDTTFHEAGIVDTPITSSKDDWGFATAVQPDGNVIVAGSSGSGGVATPFVDPSLTRYLPNGSLDERFGTGGSVTTRLVDYDALGCAQDVGGQFLDVAVQGDGKIVAVGNTGHLFQEAFLVARYQADGSADDSFGQGGVVINKPIREGRTDSRDTVRRIFLQPGGKIVTVGSVELCRNPGGSCSTYQPWEDSETALVRYNPDGTLDTSFGADHTGMVFFSSSSDANGDVVSDAALRVDGKIVALTGGAFAPRLVQFRSDGFVDGSFGVDGVVNLQPFGQEYFAPAFLAVQPDSKLVIATTVPRVGSSDDFAVLRYNADGTVDSTFGDNHSGRVFTNLGGPKSFDVLTALGIRWDGKILVAGTAQALDDRGSTLVEDITIVRYDSVGRLDHSFGPSPGGINTVKTLVIPGDSIVGSSATAAAISFQSDGKAIVTGTILDTANGGGVSDFSRAGVSADADLFSVRLLP